MNWLHRVQQHLAITESECIAVLVLSGLLLLGMGFQYAQRHAQAVPEGAYAEVDSLLRQGAGQFVSGHGAETADSTHIESIPGFLRDDSGSLRARVNLNSATAAELERLPRIGPKLAARIIAYREANGPFERVQDLTRVSGIGDKTLLRLDGLVYVGNKR